MNFYFCDLRNDWYLGSGAEVDQVDRETATRWAKQYPASRRYFATADDRERRAKGNTARELLALWHCRDQHDRQVALGYWDG